MSFYPPDPEAASGQHTGVISPALDIAGVSHSYGKRKALIDVSFSVRRASFCVLLGLNGAGKSTLFCLITRLFAAQKGTIRIFGFDVNCAPAKRYAGLASCFKREPSISI